jgi:hypothetical protein
MYNQQTPQNAKIIALRIIVQFWILRQFIRYVSEIHGKFVPRETPPPLFKKRLFAGFVRTLLITRNPEPTT